MSLRPRLGPKESRLWENWQEAHGGDYKNYNYDVRVEPQALEFTKEGEPILRNWEKLGSPRIDVCACSKTNMPVIFEVKPDANFETIAQVIAYKEFMRLFGRLIGQPEMVIVCRTMGNINEKLCQKYGIKVYKIPEKDKIETLPLPLTETEKT